MAKYPMVINKIKKTNPKILWEAAIPSASACLAGGRTKVLVSTCAHIHYKSMARSPVEINKFNIFGIHPKEVGDIALMFADTTHHEWRAEVDACQSLPAGSSSTMVMDFLSKYAFRKSAMVSGSVT